MEYLKKKLAECQPVQAENSKQLKTINRFNLWQRIWQGLARVWSVDYRLFGFNSNELHFKQVQSI